MTVILVLAVAFTQRVDPRRLLLLASAVFLPFFVGGLLVLWAWRARPREDNRAALFCEAVAAELRAGAGLRAAVSTAAGSIGIDVDPLRREGEPSLGDLATTVAGELPAIERELSLTLAGATRSGSRAADLFDEIGSLALAQSEVRREVRMATAPGRATAMIFVGAPLTYLTLRAASGGLGGMLASSQQRSAAIIGLGLFLVGAAGALTVTWRSAR